MRPVLADSKIETQALKAIGSFHSDVVSETAKVVASNEWVIVGMRQNQVVKKARKYLDDNKIAYKYVEHGSYFGQWQQRLAIKLWSGWPTFPQVFHNGQLVGGCREMIAQLKK